MATFTSVSQAVDAAIAIQAGFARQPLQLRIGVNLGDVIEEGGDVFGDGVNLAARLEAMAEPGGVLVSEPVVRSVAGKPGVAFEGLGTRRGRICRPRSRSMRCGGATRWPVDRWLAGGAAGSRHLPPEWHWCWSRVRSGPSARPSFQG